jgi:hypothetical protein
VLRQIPEFEKPAPTSNSPCVSPGNGDNAGTGDAYHPAGDLLLPSDGPARRTSGPLREARVNPRHLLATVGPGRGRYKPRSSHFGGGLGSGEGLQRGLDVPDAPWLEKGNSALWDRSA